MSKRSVYEAKVPGPDGKIAYGPDEDKVWQDLVTRQRPNVSRWMAKPYLDGLDRLNLPQSRVPQAVNVSDVLRPLTGWRVEPVPALIGFKRFFWMLSERVFPAASFIRSRKDFDYIKEPDIFHEIWGHTPLLTDRRFAAFSQAIGQAGRVADPADYAWLIRLYWFTIEFGLTIENGEVKALGSGLASSPTELPWAVSGQPVLRPFDVVDILRTPYRIDIHQPLYFVIEDLDDLFAASSGDIAAQIQTARDLGLHAPLYEPEPVEA